MDNIADIADIADMPNISNIPNTEIIPMITHESKLQSPYYEYIRDGIKIYELRVYDNKRKQMKINDEWVFSHNNIPGLPKIKTNITTIKIYESFEQAIKDTGYNKLLPDAKSDTEAIKIYNGFDNNNYEKDALVYGVVRFGLELKS